MQDMRHGGNVWDEARPGDWLDYSANLRPEGTPEWVLETMRRAIVDTRSYPDRQMRAARAGLAAGCRAVLLRSGWGKREAAAVRQSLPRTPVLPDLAAACAYILARDA